jgi:hypothetical protein
MAKGAPSSSALAINPPKVTDEDGHRAGQTTSPFPLEEAYAVSQSSLSSVSTLPASSSPSSHNPSWRGPFPRGGTGRTSAPRWISPACASVASTADAREMPSESPDPDPAPSPGAAPVTRQHCKGLPRRCLRCRRRGHPPPCRDHPSCRARRRPHRRALRRGGFKI